MLRSAIPCSIGEIQPSLGKLQEPMFRGSSHGNPFPCPASSLACAWNTRSLAEEPIMRLILDGTVVRVRLDRKATAISLLVVIGVRADGQKILLAVKP